MDHKPFDIEAARNGAQVRTRSGSPARIVCFDATGPQPLVVLLKEKDAWQYTIDGYFNKTKDEGGFGNLDLVMA
jgi:hypothetical protein